MSTRSGRRRRLLWSAALVFALSDLRAWGQVTTADLVGTVTDSTGELIAGATAVTKNLGTGESRTTQSDVSGNYVFTLLPVGRYSLRIELPAFKTSAVTELVLAGGDRVRVDARMEFGLQEAVEVVTAPAGLQTDVSPFKSFSLGDELPF